MRGDGSFGLAQQPIARTHREAVGIAHCRHLDHFHTKVEIGDHPPDHGELLRVFLAEIGAPRLHNVEELEHHVATPSKMSGTESPAQMLGHRARFDKDALRRRIHFSGGRGEQEIGAPRFAEGRVHAELARISLEVAGAVELNGVHEQAHHHGLVFAARQVQKGSVTGVERAHGGNQADLSAGGRWAERRPDFAYRMEDTHG